MQDVFLFPDARSRWERGVGLCHALRDGAWPEGYWPSSPAHADALCWSAEARVGLFSKLATLCEGGQTAEALTFLRDALAVVALEDPILWNSQRPDEAALFDLYKRAGQSASQARIDSSKYRTSDEGWRIAVDLTRKIAAKHNKSAA